MDSGDSQMLARKEMEECGDDSKQKSPSECVENLNKRNGLREII